MGTERAYLRSDALDPRRVLMQRWADFLLTVPGPRRQKSSTRTGAHRAGRVTAHVARFLEGPASPACSAGPSWRKPLRLYDMFKPFLRTAWPRIVHLTWLGLTPRRSATAWSGMRHKSELPEQWRQRRLRQSKPKHRSVITMPGVFPFIRYVPRWHIVPEAVLKERQILPLECAGRRVRPSRANRNAAGQVERPELAHAVANHDGVGELNLECARGLAATMPLSRSCRALMPHDNAERRITETICSLSSSA